MSYTPTTWTTGDTITATAMNKIENGIANAGSALICNSSYSQDAGTDALDKTVQEIYDALLSGTPVYIKYQYGLLSEYAGTLYLAPVIKIYNYDYTNVIRICASKPTSIGNKGNFSSVFSPAVLIYQASDVDDYPTFYTTISTSSTAVSTNGIG